MLYLRFICIGALAMIACAQLDTPKELSAEARQVVVEEIKQGLDDYIDAAMRNDLKAMLGFWSDSKDFVYAGDGHIIGYEDWVDQLKKYSDETERWLSWEVDNVKVAVLSATSASCTYEFEYSKIVVGGETFSARGAWTNVYKKYGKRWKVIQANGTHIEL